MNLISLFITGLLTGNVILSKFLGICPFIGSSNKEKTDYSISDNGKKEELFRFFDNYGQNGIKINVEPHFEDLYK